MDTVNPVEAVWLAASGLALVVTGVNLFAGIVRWWGIRRDAVLGGRAKARVVQARANIRRDGIRLGQSICAVIVVIPSLLRPGDVEINIFVIAIILIPSGLALNSYLDWRVRRTVERLVGK